jgi:hypothetical protein
MASIQLRVKSNGAVSCTTTIHTHLVTKVFNMTPLETLKAARQLITDPAKWTQGWFALNANGDRTFGASQQAVCWCALGAIDKFDPPNFFDLPNAQAKDKFERFCLSKNEQGVSHYNDTHTHAEVLALFDAAIAELEGVQP